MLSYSRNRLGWRLPSFMNEVAQGVSDRPLASVLGLLIAFMGTAVCILYCSTWAVGLATIIVFYTIFNFVIFCHSRPRDWEASVLFFAFLMGAAAFILLFGWLYQTHDMLSLKAIKQDSGCPVPTPWTDGIWDHLYYSTVVFTTLGFGDLTPKVFEGKVTTSVEALLGLAYGVTAVFVFLGRLAWLNAKGAADEPKPRDEVQPMPQASIEALLRLSTDQSKQIAELHALHTSHANDTKQRLERLSTTVWVLIALIAALVATVAALAVLVLRQS